MKMDHKIKTGIVTLGLLLLLIITLKVADYGVTYFFSSEKTPIDSTEVWKSHGLSKDQFDSVYSNIEKVVTNNHKEIKDKKTIDSLTHLVKIAEPVNKTTLKVSVPSKNWVPDTTYLRDPSTTRFYLVTNAGYITDKHGTVEYFLPAYDQRYYYELILHRGVYSFQSLAQDHDTVSFVVDKSGVYKLGFQENHPNFIILRDSLP